MKRHFSFKISLAYAAIILGGMSVAGILSVPGILRNSDLKSFLGNAKNREQLFFDSFPANDACLLPGMFLNHVLDRRYYPTENYYIREDGQILQGSLAPIDPSACADNIAMLKEVCEAQNKDFIYVLCPGKPMEDKELRLCGIECYRNENSDSLLDALDKRAVPYLDLRPALKELSGGNLYKWFYKSDHHWTADAGIEAARLITGELNARCFCELEEMAIKKENLKRTVLKGTWCGEMGKKILGPWSQKDHLVVWKPKMPGHFHLSNTVSGIETDGGFEVFFHDELLKKLTSREKRTLYYYYMGGNDALVKIDNLDLEKGNILIVKDSFSNVVVPYLSLTSAHVTIWDMRENQNILPYLQEHPEIETVVVMYTTAFSVKSNMNDFQ